MLDDHQPSSATDGAESTDRFAVPGFDSVARLAARSLNVPLVALVLHDGSAYWYTTDAGNPAHTFETPAPVYLHAARRSTTEVVLDTQDDERFRHAMFTTEPASSPIRFFASEPVFTLTDQQIGALCVMDRVPRIELDERERSALRDAASLAGTGVVLRSYLGRTDPVTQLPHRNAFFEDLRAHMDGGADNAWLTAIEVAPVERFNAFIRAMGHVYADELMRAVAARVQAWLAPNMRLYQVGVTRFAVLLTDTHAHINTDRLDDLVALLRRPFDCLGIPLTLQPGVGLLKVGANELRGGDSLRLVMSASHAAQGSVRGWVVYEREQDERHRQEFFLVTELAAALTERAELDLYYQPRVDLDTGRCVALEALARWHHPTLGQILPSAFISLAERAGLMRVLTEWVLDHGVAQLAAWQRSGLDIKLSLNVSSADFGADLVTRLESATARHGVDPRMLELEFTESTLMQHSDATRRYLAAIRQLGTGIAIDDFGTGYSNLASLRQMPATSLKIDQSFVRSIDASRHDAAIVRSVADLARDLGFRVVAEGVETARVYDAVLDMACDEVQGFHVARPLPASAVADWLQQHVRMRARQHPNL
jgi:EAL domain-containing protein (putative c-di-GMP-specific phosphodiesterase class I)/GGDEF domain-containing protein